MPDFTARASVPYFFWGTVVAGQIGGDGLVKALRKKEQKSDTFTIFCRKLLRVARRYPSAASLIPSMAKRVQAVLKHGGAMTKY